MAVGLDSTNSLLRSYLGKAYFEEKRDPLDGKQFAIAKALDPLDPTPYLYDAIRLQSINRPVDAMLNMEKSIELNDNRAIYRSRELLDSDRATRGANLAQIYNNLGFDQLGLNQGYDSLMFAPDNSAAHRFLSDAYIGVPRREIARVSELFQAQMLQDININPVQPSLAETNLSLLARGGPFIPGLNEYTPLFERNDIQLVGSGLRGRGDMLDVQSDMLGVQSLTPTPTDFNRKNDDTVGLEGIASALYNRFSVSAGDFHYDTDGWRPNAGFEHDISNFFIQTAVTPELNVQAEVRHRESEQGDLAFNFDPEFFNPDFKRSIDTDTWRVGTRYALTPNSGLLFSYISSDVLEEDSIPGSKSSVDDKGAQEESQYIYRGEWLNLVAGGWNTHIDRTFETIPPILEEIDHRHGYTYTNIKFPQPVIWTVGFSYDDFEHDPIDIQKLNPKFGVRWDVTPNISLRGAVFRWVKPPLTANRSLEPTQVAGFDQVFDDVNGDQSWRRGVGLDWRITKQLFTGAEATWRNIDIPNILIGLEEPSVEFETWKEQLHRAYLFWTPTKSLSLSAQAIYDAFHADKGILTIFGTPEQVTTFSVPLSVRYFAPNGLFAAGSVTYVNQKVVRSPIATENLGFSDGSDNFAVVDAIIGWRFPKRLGIASLGVYNLFDTHFRYQDDSFREFRDEPSSGPYIPERRVVGRLTLYF
jgi:hypothetical protein